MKFLQNKRFTGTAITLLLLLNIALLVLLFVKSPKRQGARFEGNEGPRNYIISELKLDPQQQKQYLQMVDEHHARVLVLEKEIHAMRDTLVLNLRTGSPSDSLVHAITERVGTKQQELDQVTFDHFMKLRNICTPEQQKRFGEIIQDVLRRMAPHPPGPPEEK